MGRQSQKVFAFVLAFWMVFGSIGISHADAPDYTNHWAASQISAWMSKGWVTGYSGGNFEPNQSITRAEFAVIVNRAFGFTALADIAYKDVPSSAWYLVDLQKAKAEGYLTGYADLTFHPQNPITRQEVAIVLLRLMKAQASDLTGLSAFTDQNQIATWGREAMSAMLQNHIFSGYPDQTLRPSQQVTRGETVALLNRALEALSTTNMISDVEKNNTFGSFRITTSKVTTAEALLAAIKANGEAVAAVEKRDQGEDGKAWKVTLKDPKNNVVYQLACAEPFEWTGVQTLTWVEAIASAAVTGVKVNDSGNANNGSDLEVTFVKASGETKTVKAYRVFVVKAANASAFNLKVANAIPADRYTEVAKTGSDITIKLTETVKDTDGVTVGAGTAYQIFVLTVADGVNATENALSQPLEAITLGSVSVGYSGTKVGALSNPGTVGSGKIKISTALEAMKNLNANASDDHCYLVVAADADAAVVLTKAFTANSTVIWDATLIADGSTTTGQTTSLRGTGVTLYAVWMSDGVIEDVKVVNNSANLGQ